MKTKQYFQSKRIDLFLPDSTTYVEIPYVEPGIACGFPSPADDYMGLKIDLNEALIKNPEATFFARVKGDSMIGAGMEDQDLLIIDRSLEHKNNKIAVCLLDGEFTIKRLKMEKDVAWLMPENEKYKPIKVTADNDFTIWGIVNYIIKAV